MRKLLIPLALTVAGCGGQNAGTEGALAGGTHPLTGLYSGDWTAGSHKGSTAFGIAKDGVWTGNFYDPATDRTFVTDPDPTDDKDEAVIAQDGSFVLATKYDEDGTPVRLVGTVTASRIQGTLTVGGGAAVPFGCRLRRR